MEKRTKITQLVFTGPECTGKTTLSKLTSEKFNFPLVTEFARTYLNNLNRSYNYNDLVTIAKGQINLENQADNQRKSQKFIVCDTNLQVIKLWSQIKYSRCDPFIIKNEKSNAFYFLCYPDFAWEEDPQRENPNNRIEIFKLYEKDLIKNNREFLILTGDIKQRLSKISKTINALNY